MTIARTPTLLSLDRYAKIMGLNLSHFSGASGVSGGLAPMPTDQSCSQLWFQHPWQSNGKVSREELAFEIAQAEEEIARTLGYWPAPTWMCEEVTQFPQHHRPDEFGANYNVRGMPLSVITRYGKVIAGGQRAATFIGTPAGAQIVASDPDVDGWNELRTITFPTTLLDACEIKVYYSGYSGDPAFEIREPISKVITGGNVVIVFYSWQLINPTLWEALPNDIKPVGLDLNGAIYVASVDLYKEYNDESASASEFYWEPSCNTLSCLSCGGTGCAACALTTQLGCLHVRNAHAGIVVPMPGEYDRSTGAWASSGFSICRRPDFVKLWYYSGELDNRKLCVGPCDPLSDYWAKTIAVLATARLRKPLCGCGAAQAEFERLQKDTSFSATGDFFTGSIEDVKNPFGTKVGEILAWRKVAKLNTRRLGVACV
jgi:hypothetical protein